MAHETTEIASETPPAIPPRVVNLRNACCTTLRARCRSRHEGNRSIDVDMMKIFPSKGSSPCVGTSFFTASTLFTTASSACHQYSFRLFPRACLSCRYISIHSFFYLFFLFLFCSFFLFKLGNKIVGGNNRFFF